ncbi:MAG: hypothetical protein EU529_15605 [Promethearchaeota archaeon]|nr:MAG: hypothetical protein EU540_01175 [Candidatus Lokiarchaeota archaeon]TFG19978.1 MAG: hypothetical protein EU529_15605 [Candidatus Lokiarchaeota archaeon]
MTSVEIKTDFLEKLRKKFKSQFGENLSDQEILEKCLEFSNKHIDELLLELLNANLIIKKKKSLYDLMTGILEEEYNLIKSSGKSIKEVIHESWRY